MSRATLTNVFNVAGDKALASSAHAFVLSSPVELATALVGSVSAAPFRNTRRSYLLRGSTSLMAFLHLLCCSNCSTGSAEPAAALDHLDLVAVRIGHKEEARQGRAVVLEIAQRSRCQLLTFEAGMLGVEIFDHDSEMAVAIAERVGLLAAVIDGQLDLERRGGMAQIDQREIVEVQMIGDLQPKDALVEVERLGLVAHAEH